MKIKSITNMHVCLIYPMDCMILCPLFLFIVSGSSLVFFNQKPLSVMKRRSSPVQSSKRCVWWTATVCYLVNC